MNRVILSILISLSFCLMSGCATENTMSTTTTTTTTSANAPDLSTAPQNKPMNTGGADAALAAHKM